MKYYVGMDIGGDICTGSCGNGNRNTFRGAERSGGCTSNTSGFEKSREFISRR